MQERIRKRYDKGLMATHRRRHLRKWALWNRYESFRAKMSIDFRVLNKRYYWHKKVRYATPEEVIAALEAGVRRTQSEMERLLTTNLF